MLLDLAFEGLILAPLLFRSHFVLQLLIKQGTQVLEQGNSGDLYFVRHVNRVLSGLSVLHLRLLVNVVQKFLKKMAHQVMYTNGCNLVGWHGKNVVANFVLSKV